MAALGAAEFTELIASTLDKIEKTELVDNVTTQHPLLELFKSSAASATGLRHVINLEVGEDGGTQWTDSSGTFSTAKSTDVIGSAVYDWSDPLVSKVRLTWKQLEMNSGPEQVIDLVKTHLNSAQKQHAKSLVGALHAVATAPNVGGKDARGLTPGTPESLDTLVSDTAVVGGIDPAAHSYWKSVRKTITKTAEADIKRAFRTIADDIYVASDGASAPTHIVCGRAVFSEYENSLDDKVRYTSLERGETRFRTLYFDELEVRLDPDCPTDRAYFLDKDSLRMRYLGDNFMKVREAQTITGTFDTVTPIASVVLFGTAERRSNGLLIRTA